MNNSGNINCSFYNETMCSNGGCVPNVVTGRYCYSIWSNGTNDESITTNLTTTNRAVSQVKIKQRGCLTGQNDCANSTKCIASRYTKGHYFCCCKEDFCNEEVYLLSNISEHSPHQAKTSQIHGSDSNWSYALIASLASIVLIFIILYIWFKRRKKRLSGSKRYSEAGERILITNQMNGINSCTKNDAISLTRNHGGGDHNGSNPANGYRIELIEKLSTGRFGCVWKAKMFNCKKELLFSSGGSICYDVEDKETQADDSLIPSTINTVASDSKDSLNYKIVAVKIFPPNEKSSWISEQQVFKTPQIEHENILRFLGSEKRDDPNNVPLSPSGFWLITEYHELGSLCDYLKKHTVNIDQLVKISIGIAAGLNHLHYEIPEGGDSGGGGGGRGKGDNQINMKASIVHRDFKSRNVLLKSDLTPRIADFGLALIFYPSRTPAELGQVGTRRYMAPEVLEGAISYTQDSLYRIDIYACALVLWEIVSRCHGSDKIKTADGDEENITVSEYKLPFEQEVGLNPSLEDMQETVCQAKKRPILRQQWLNHPILKMICQTIEECWDQDAEARLSASCILERLTILAKNRI